MRVCPLGIALFDGLAARCSRDSDFEGPACAGSDRAESAFHAALPRRILMKLFRSRLLTWAEAALAAYQMGGCSVTDILSQLTGG